MVKSDYPGSSPSLLSWFCEIPVLMLIDFHMEATASLPPSFCRMISAYAAQKFIACCNLIARWLCFSSMASGIMHAGNRLDHLVAEEIHLVVGHINTVGQLLN
jgi:hypothetical protein